MVREERFYQKYNLKITPCDSAGYSLSVKLNPYITKYSNTGKEKCM